MQQITSQDLSMVVLTYKHHTSIPALLCTQTPDPFSQITQIQYDTKIKALLNPCVICGSIIVILIYCGVDSNSQALLV